MGLSHRKRLRRHVEFYQTAFGFYEPFKVTSLTVKVRKYSDMAAELDSGRRQGDLCELLQSSFLKRLKAFCTPCIIKELRSLGDAFSNTVDQAEGLNTHKCGHSPCISAADCLINCIGDSNADHWWVATQDERLRQVLSSIPGVPCLFLTYNGLFIETPSEASTTAAKNAEDAALSVPEWEMATAVLQDLGELSRQHSRSIFRKKKAKGPNPLSCLKKKTRGVNEQKTELKKKRKRRKPKDTQNMMT